MKKSRVNKKPANTVQLSNSKPRDVKAIENLKELASALPACSDITGALRYLCEVVAPIESKRFLAQKIA